MNLSQIIDQALAEDIGSGDHTTLATIPDGLTGSAKLIAKDNGIICGIEIAKAVFNHVDKELFVATFFTDGDRIKPNDIVFSVTGSRKSILMAERLVLNFMQRLSGIATQTREMTDLIAGFKATILDTRKTTPLLRELEKYAVRAGGGGNHRMGLYDMILIKDNHIDFAGGITQAINAARKYMKSKNLDLKIEIEVRSFQELDTVLDYGKVDRIMLDNFSPANLSIAVKKVNGRFETEASGGITRDTIRDYASSGVDYISMGALTHQIKSLDLSLKASDF